jgi:hypothetical protein
VPAPQAPFLAPHQRSIIEASFSYDRLPALRRYVGPRLAIVTPSGDSPHDLHHLIPNLPRRRLEGTSHWIHMDEREAFNRWLEEFFASLAETAPLVSGRSARMD